MSMALEALAINYLGHTVWAWIAFLTAALSLWKIKSSSHSPSPPPPPPQHKHISLSSPSPSPPPPPPLTSTEPDPDQHELPSTTTTTFCLLENRRSGKFSVYYGEDESVSIGRNQMRRTGSVRHINNYKNDNNNPDGWEALLKLKTAEMGWYRYQDLTMLDGSVVQLWNQFNHHVLVDY